MICSNRRLGDPAIRRVIQWTIRRSGVSAYRRIVNCVRTSLFQDVTPVRRFAGSPARAFLLIVALAMRCAASGEPDAFALSGVGARAGGMGNAFVGLSDEIESVYYNPAGLGNLVQSGVTAMYQTPMLDTSRGFLGFNKRWAHPQFPGSAAFGWLRMRSADIELTNTDEEVTGSDSLTNDLFLLGVGVHPFEHYSFGATVKYMRFAFNGFSEGGFGVDLGVHGQYRPFRFGATLSDIGGTVLSGDSVAGGDVSDEVPTRFRPGVGLVVDDLFGWPIRAAFDVDALMKLQGAQEAKLFTGAEFWGFQSRVALRGGYQGGNGPTFGFGARIGPVQFDYSFLMSLNLRDEHRLGTTYRF